jgi:predicted RNase H-like HicB family nuclease
MKYIKINGFLALFEKDGSGGYSVSFPDLPGCFTCGSTLEEAERNAKEALELWLESV